MTQKNCYCSNSLKASTSSQIETPDKFKNNQCCWRRSKRKTLSKNSEIEDSEKTNETFNYYGIPLLSPTDYYRFLNQPQSIKNSDLETTVLPTTLKQTDSQLKPISVVLLATTKEPQLQPKFCNVFKLFEFFLL